MARKSKTKNTTVKDLAISQGSALIDASTEEELENLNGVIEIDDFTLKCKPREQGFLVNYDSGWEDLPTLPLLELHGIEIYHAHYDGTTYHRRSLSDPPPRKESSKWDKLGKLAVCHPKYGKGGFLLTASGVRAFKGYRAKWAKQGIDVFGRLVRISSRLTKTQAGFLLNVPKFLPGWVHEVSDSTPPAEAEVNVENCDDVPF
jgi:hypothetical protein